MIEVENEFSGNDAEAEAPADTRRNVVKKKMPQVSKAGVPGDIYEWHRKENEHEVWEEPCYWVKYRVRAPGGISINEKRYQGEVTVPQCVADYLAWQDSKRAQYEKSIFRGRVNQVVAGVR